MKVSGLFQLIQVCTTPVLQCFRSKHQWAVQLRKANKDQGFYLIIIILEGVFNIQAWASSFHPVHWSFMLLIMGRRCLLLLDFTLKILLLSFDVVPLLSCVRTLCTQPLSRRWRIEA